MNEPIVTVRGLTKECSNKVILNDVSFDVYEGESFALIGPNGAGKTTIVEILAGVRGDYEGEVLVFGEVPGDARVKEKLGVQLEAPFLVWNLKVSETLDMFRSFYPHPVAIEQLLLDFGLGDKKNSYLRKLSKGERHKVGIALALAGGPLLLILDEPTSGLSPEARSNLWAILDHEKRKGKTILFTTHYLEEAEKWADRLALVHNGKITCMGRIETLVQDLVGAQEKIVIMEDELKSSILLKDNPNIAYMARTSTETLIYTENPRQVVEALLDLGVKNMKVGRVSLEDVYFKATGSQYVEDKSIH